MCVNDRRRPLSAGRKRATRLPQGAVLGRDHRAEHRGGCPDCGGGLRVDGERSANVTGVPASLRTEVREYRAQVSRCMSWIGECAAVSRRESDQRAGELEQSEVVRRLLAEADEGRTACRLPRQRPVDHQTACRIPLATRAVELLLVSPPDYRPWRPRRSPRDCHSLCADTGFGAPCRWAVGGLPLSPPRSARTT